ncbi:tyrosine-type recombinase/integrase [Nocardia cyriacigeorgica]|nr:tyrosine-type recombinase/integrase [Nocardia cyriacigeorgica]
MSDRDLARIVVPKTGGVVTTTDEGLPFRVEDAAGIPIAVVDSYLLELMAAGRAVSTLRSYAMDLLRWFRFLWAVGVAWDRATRTDARDFSIWIRLTVNPARNRRASAEHYAPATVAHSETVLRLFYEHHRDVGDGPILNPFPTSPHRIGRPNAHHNPMNPFRHERAGRYRPRVPTRVPRGIPDDAFNRLFAGLPSNRDRALVAFFVSSGARASELVGMDEDDTDPGQQLITVVRKGSRARQQIPASADAFVWLRLYQDELHGLVARGRKQPLWRIRRRPYTRLTYHAAHRMFERLNARLDTEWTLHSLRHTAAYRMANDPDMPLTDVQWVLGHAHLTTTQKYTTPTPEDVIARTAAHFQRQAARDAEPAPPAIGYHRDSLDILFGRAR